MPITIKGIRIEEINLKPDTERGGLKIESASYSLISSVDKVLAKQTVGGYGGLVLQPSSTTLKLLDSFLAAYKADVQAALGLETE